MIPHFYIDERPFVNTVSQKKYNPWCDTFHFFTIYRTGWCLPPGLLPFKKLGELALTVNVYAVPEQAKADYTDLYDSRIAECWITHIYRETQATWGQLLFRPLDNGFMELNFQDKAVARAQAEQLDIEHEHITLNQQPWVQTSPFANVIDFHTIVGQFDMLTFSFEIGTKTVNEEQTDILIESANKLLHQIINSVSITYPESKALEGSRYGPT